MVMQDWKKGNDGKVILGAIRKIALGDKAIEMSYDDALREHGFDPIPELTKTLMIPCLLECSNLEGDWQVLQLALSAQQATQMCSPNLKSSG